ncbi:serine hydrolase [Sphingobium sp. CR28]|uniref:serine hydrolase n=1 Tax=Sphingobium sp. CR28 TaxID=3400272 RepID=UPI003FF0176C
MKKRIRLASPPRWAEKIDLPRPPSGKSAQSHHQPALQKCVAAPIGPDGRVTNLVGQRLLHHRLGMIRHLAHIIAEGAAHAAGGIVSDAQDMALAWAALLDGRFLRKPLQRERTAIVYPMFDPGTYYGLGMMIFEVPNGQRTLRWIGHAGGAPGTSAIALYSPDDGAIVTVALTGDGSATAGANLLLKALAPSSPKGR